MPEKRGRFSLEDVARAAFDLGVPLASRIKSELMRLVKNQTPVFTGVVKVV